MNIAEWLASTARTNGHAPALFKGQQLDADYAEFARRAAAIGAYLQHRYGVAPGDRIGLFMKNCTEYLELLYGIWWAGAVALPINAKLHPKEAEWILADSGAKLVFISVPDDSFMASGSVDGLAECRSVVINPQLMAELRASKEVSSPLPSGPGDLAWLFYTSGTTGKPKGVMITHANLVAMSLCYPMDVVQVEPTDAVLYAAPMSHGAGLYNFIHVRRAARHVVPDSGGFDAAEVLQLAKKLDDVTLFAAPTMVRRLVSEAKQRGECGEGIKCIVYGGGPMYQADVKEAFEVMGPRFAQIYGQGESPMTITSLSHQCMTKLFEQKRFGVLASTGLAQSCVQVSVVGSNGVSLPSGEVGEVVVKGSTVMAGYWRNSEATEATLRQGWLWTGDMGSLDDKGYLTLSDRSKDVIISGGSNIYPREVEEVLLLHRDVEEVSVIGRPHAEWGEEVVAVVVMAPGATLNSDALDTLCVDHIARFKRPKTYIEIACLPKNNYGKILKTELREQMASGALG